MLIDKYRNLQLKINFESFLSKHLDSGIDTLNSVFRPDDFFVSRNNEGLDIWLREINLSSLEYLLTSQKSEQTKELFKLIYDEISKIRSYGIKGNKRLYVGYNKERKVIQRKNKEIRRGKHYYANDNTFEIHSNQLPTEYKNQIICGDSHEILKKLPDSCIDLVFTSPPYNFGLDYETSDDAIDWDGYFNKLFVILDECIRVLKYGGRLVMNVQPLFSDYIPSHHIISTHLMNQKMIWKGEILWEKNNYNCKYTAWGSWKSPSSPYLKYTWEFVEVFCKGSLKKTGKSSDADIDTDSFKEWVVAKWSIAPERNMRKFQHPAMYPVELARRVILLFSFRNDIVLDPFNGAGTTCVAANAHNRTYLGIDVSREYCDMSKSRLSRQSPLCRLQ